ncbi:MAG: VWA domain-containing protein [Nitrospirae bacterium]|nr:VWA domain-containing protein [Nitrospirota bacterium]MBF0536065.1 VWA domain-containing protein [Nitrospirota bacterium]MBF0617974.1 VWA domain-containing protein [Nitrospirota bacterium]
MKLDIGKVVYVCINITLFLILCSRLNADDKAVSHIDVALAIDSSGSMKKTDPQNLRIAASKLFLLLLNGKDRVGIMSFDTDVYHLTGLNEVIDKKIFLAAVNKVTSNGLYTNLYKAIEKSLEMLDSDEMPGKTKIIILMTDGKMDTGNRNRDRMLEDKLKAELVEKTKVSNIKIFTIAFSDESDKELLEAVSKKTGGFYYIAKIPEDLHHIFLSIFEALKMPDMLPFDSIEMDGNSFIVDNSIKEVNLIIKKTSVKKQIMIKSPTGELYKYNKKPDTVTWFSSPTFDMVTIKNPPEGKWYVLNCTGKGNKVYIITSLKLMANFNNQEIFAGKTINIEAWFQNEQKEIIKDTDILKENGLYIELTSPESEVVKIPLTDTAAAGSGVYSASFTPNTPGMYTLRIAAYGKTFEREKILTFIVNDIQKSPQSPENENHKVETSVQNKPKIKKKHTAASTGKEKSSYTKVAITLIILNIVFVVAIVVIIKLLRRKKLLGWVNDKN